VVIDMADTDDNKDSETEVADDKTTQVEERDDVGNEETVEEGVAELQRKLDDAERGRREAERRADEMSRRVGQAETTAHGTQLAFIQGALDTLNTNRETLIEQYAAAMANGEFAEGGKIQARMADEAAQKIELERGKSALESQRPAAPRPMASEADKLEAYTKTLQPRAAAWIRAHPEYVLDPRKNQQMLSQHYAALSAGHEEGGDAYFTFIEGGLRPTRERAPAPEKEIDPTAGAAKETQRRDVQPSPAAPSRGGSRSVRLDARQQEAARISGMTDEEYAKIMERERRAGNIGKAVH
jgi:hypothetical protein